jgi:hypothetical protein
MTDTKQTRYKQRQKEKGLVRFPEIYIKPHLIPKVKEYIKQLGGTYIENEEGG